MTWTYAGDPSASSLAAIRFLIQDTDTNDQLLSDEEINYLISTYSSNVYLAAAEACNVIALQFARDEALVTIGDTTVDNKKRSATYRTMAAHLTLQARRAGTAGGLFVGGVSVSGVEALDEDETSVQPKIRPADWENV